MMLIKRYFFWLFLAHRDDSWYSYWLNTDLDGYLKFRNFARNHEFYDDTCSMVLQDRVTLFQILTDFFDTDIENDFEAKFQIWLSRR
jgi:hypothetical protein